MRKSKILASAAVAVLVAITPAWAGHFVGFVGTHGPFMGTGILIFGDALIEQLSDQDLLFLRLGLRREFFRSVIPDIHQQPGAVAVVPGQGPEAAGELDRLILRLGELIRELERSQQP